MKKLPFVISAPHCSGGIPTEIRQTLVLSDQEVEESTDVGTREVFGSLPASMVLCASWSRLVVDLNRSPEQRDRKGVVALVDYGGRSIYRPETVPDEEEVERRVRMYYHPYHHQLRSALEENEIAGLIDCHSLFGLGPPEAPDPGEKRKDIVLSNNGDLEGCARKGFGATSCQADLLKAARAGFEDEGFTVSLNRPYAGGYITTHYGASLSKKGKMAFQIEINQDLYCTRGTLCFMPEKVEEVTERVARSLSLLAERIREV